MSDRRPTCFSCGGRLDTKGTLRCQWCGAELSGKVRWSDNVAQPATAPTAREMAIEMARERQVPLTAGDPTLLSPEQRAAIRETEERWAAEDAEYVRDSEHRAAKELYGERGHPPDARP